ncbi:hedgehog signaling protein [Lycorma delicatula]|uniref:hedgehog signaling protein n=1 Tax=Lycorma delicatula TaxID=130591 RepID=UPI003F50F6E6
MKGVFLYCLMVLSAAAACGPGRGAGRRRVPKKLTPLVFKQHIPNVSENTLAASGLQEGRIARNSKKFFELVPNYNNDIIFKDEEGTGADRLMTQRCLEKLNTLAISVMNQWPGVKLRVTEGWDEEDHHASDSLHYEGRAVDITTSDRDRSKYGMLARMAVEAGFDWVYYESRSHIHCSVKSESSQAGRTGGCFTGNSKVLREDGTILELKDLQIGDSVLTIDSSGNLVYSEVILFLDRDPNEVRPFLKISTSSGAVINITPSHLIMRVDDIKDLILNPVYADSIIVGDNLLIRNQTNNRLVVDKVVSVKPFREKGVYAPLTRTGMIIVNNITASCYALISSQTLAHFAFAPVRLYINIKESFYRFWTVVTSPLKTLSDDNNHISKKFEETKPQIGIHWYPNLLFKLSHYIVPDSMMHNV